jgi:hypothetical protein
LDIIIREPFLSVPERRLAFEQYEEDTARHQQSSSESTLMPRQIRRSSLPVNSVITVITVITVIMRAEYHGLEQASAPAAITTCIYMLRKCSIRRL